MQPDLTKNVSEAGHELRVLVVAPTGRDASLLCAALERGGLKTLECRSCAEALREGTAGAGAMIIAEEALTLDDITLLSKQTSNQPAWSDFPLIILTLSGEVTAQSQRRRRLRAPLSRALELERPVRPETLISTVEGALRARRRQYELRDQIVHQRQAEEALRRSEKLAVAGRLAASIAHEINNPLEAVSNLIYLARTTDSLETAREYLATAESELGRVAAITTETLKFYRQPNRASRVDISEIVASLLVLYQARIASAGITVQTDLDGQPIVGFGGELRQMFSNLLSNAIDATRGGRIIIRARHAVGPSGVEGVRMVVADNGTGIPDPVKSTVFEPFVTTKGSRGSGLGLWVASEVVRKQGGSLRVKSCTRADRHGTVFSIFLPAVAPEPVRVAAEDQVTSIATAK